MYSNPAQIPTGFLTLLCEGNNNPFSKNWSRRLRIGKKGHLYIGKGYNLTLSGEKQTLQDLYEAGVPKPKAQIFAKASTLTGRNAAQFIDFYKKEITISEKEEEKLFHSKYAKAEEGLRKLIEVCEENGGHLNSYNLAAHQWQVLVDLIYSGDLNTETEERLIQALRKMIVESKPKILNKLIHDLHYWRKNEVTEDRIRMRCVFIDDWQSITGIIFH